MAGPSAAFHVILVIVLSGVELAATIHNLRDNRLAAETLSAAEFRDVCLGSSDLFRRGAEDGGSILIANVRPLPIKLGWVMHDEESFQQLPVGNLGRIKLNLHHLRVAGAVVADILVSGVGLGASHVSTDGGGDTGANLEPMLHTPETSARKVRSHGGCRG